MVINISKNNLRLNILAKNLLSSLNEIVKNEKLVCLLANNDKNPLDNKINGEDIILENIFVEPFNMEVPQKQKTELRIFCPEGVFESANVLSTTTIYFQIIIHKDLSRIKIDDMMTLREYEIMDCIMEIFAKNHIKGISNINFQGYEYGFIDKDYHMYTLVGEIMNGR